jgi:hypothetical protein
MMISLYSALGVASSIAGYIALAASWYDLRATMKRGHVAHVVRTLRRARQPTVAIIIDADNATLRALTQCLRALRASHYHYFSVIVTTSQFNSSTKQLVRTYQQHSTRPLAYYAPRSHVSQTTRLTRAYHRLPKHNLVLVLKASDSLLPNTLKQAVARFCDDRHLGALQLSRQHTFTYSLTSLFVCYGEISQQLFRKAWPYMPRRAPSVVQSGALYRHSYFMMQAHHTAHRRGYDASCTIITTSRPLSLNSSRSIFVAWPLALLAIHYSVAAAVMAATLKSNAPLLLGWVDICLWVLLTIWSATNTQRTEKAALSCGIFVSPLLVLMQITWIAIALPIRTFTQLMRQATRIGRTISTTRNLWRRNQGTSLA